MNFYFKKPYCVLFFSTLVLGVFISLSSNNWLTVWLGLELNIYSLLPILLQSRINQEKEAATKYFLVQGLASAFILLRTISFSLAISPFLLFIRLLTKIGIAPCHIWVPIVISGISWSICWIVATIQKIPSIFIITQSIQTTNSVSITLIARLRRIVGALGGINQTQLRSILAYSSINHLGWLLARSLVSFSTIVIYFTSYLIIVSSIILNLTHSQIFSRKPESLYISQTYFLIISLLRLGGLPPLFGFFPKLLVIYSLVTLTTPIFLLSFILIISSAISLYFYLKIIFNSNAIWPKSPFLLANKKYPTSTSLFNSIFYFSSIFLGLSIFIIII